MKKFVLLASVLSVLALIIAGCAADNPAEPAPGPTATATAETLAADLMLHNFENNSLTTTVSGISASWSAANDSADGGESVITSLTVSDIDPAQGLYGLNLNATLKSRIIFPSGSAGSYTAQATDYVGYTALTLTFVDSVSLTNNTSINFFHQLSTDVTYKIFFYNDLNKYCYYNYNLNGFAGWAQTNLSIDESGGFVPGNPSAYSVEDVLKSVRKITFLIRYTGTDNTEEITRDFKFDSISLMHVEQVD